MIEYDPKKPLISIHIPKCAGSSFSDILKSWFGAGYLPHYHDEKNNIPPQRHNLQSKLFFRRFKPGICIHGHFNHERGNGVQDYYPEADQFITFLRDPFDLHLSNYFYVKREAKYLGKGAYRAGKERPVIKNILSLEEYLGRSKKSFIKAFLPPNITLDNYREILDEYFLYIGITENFQHSVNILADKLGFPRVTVSRKNVSQWEEPVPLEPGKNSRPTTSWKWQYTNTLSRTLATVNRNRLPVIEPTSRGTSRSQKVEFKRTSFSFSAPAATCGP